ncbi:MAG: BlaI/MecI/CopY family transcriptional regulator [Lachnospiraceae bacterium]|nr:BlaI/MecI/CopY family transcriptional regulator [Lachnospiraceae bacterium]
MGDIRLHEGELNVMELLWSNQSLAAKDIAKIIKDYIGWEKNTTYTVIKRLIEKGAVKREDPGFVCKAVITKNEVQQIETRALIDKVFGGELIAFFTEFLAKQNLDAEEVRELRKILDSQYRRLL